MKNKTSCKKAFSLFTPLVGTALILMSIITTTTLMQNDARVSQSLSMSYSTNYQVVMGKTITAAIETQILYSLQKWVPVVINDVEISCGDSSDDCENSIISAYTSIGLKQQLQQEVFKEFISSIEGSTGYQLKSRKYSDDTDLLQVLMQQKEIKPGEQLNAFDISVGADDKIYYQINTPDFEKYKTDLALQAGDPANPSNLLIIPILPHKFSYKTPKEVARQVRESVATFEKLLELIPKPPAACADVTSSNELKSYSLYIKPPVPPALAVYAISFTWKYDDTRDFKLVIKPNGFGDLAGVPKGDKTC